MIRYLGVIDDAFSLVVGDLDENACTALGLQDVACQILAVEVHIALPIGVLRAHLAGRVLATQKPARKRYPIVAQNIRIVGHLHVRAFGLCHDAKWV